MADHSYRLRVEEIQDMKLVENISLKTQLVTLRLFYNITSYL